MINLWPDPGVHAARAWWCAAAASGVVNRAWRTGRWASERVRGTEWAAGGDGFMSGCMSGCWVLCGWMDVGMYVRVLVDEWMWANGWMDTAVTFLEMNADSYTADRQAHLPLPTSQSQAQLSRYGDLAQMLTNISPSTSQSQAQLSRYGDLAQMLRVVSGGLLHPHAIDGRALSDARACSGRGGSDQGAGAAAAVNWITVIEAISL